MRKKFRIQLGIKFRTGVSTIIKNPDSYWHALYTGPTLIKAVSQPVEL